MGGTLKLLSTKRNWMLKRRDGGCDGLFAISFRAPHVHTGVIRQVVGSILAELTQNYPLGFSSAPLTVGRTFQLYTHHRASIKTRV